MEREGFGPPFLRNRNKTDTATPQEEKKAFCKLH